MNDEARKHIEGAISGLSEVKECLMKASNNAENGSIRERINKEMSHIEKCLEDCEGIAGGLSNQ